MNSGHSPSPEQAYFDVPEVSLEAAPIRIPHKFSYANDSYQMFVHLLGVGSEFSSPRWAVAIEVLQGQEIMLPVTRVDSELYDYVDTARQVGLKHVMQWVENHQLSGSV
ncbi:hypothetical protein IAE33_003806 [Pseudomonas sp. S60]|uniref:hypothetical protein n=1 Tax=Pseudomonas sp. S60 TaxID=211124 RepID=UPI001914A237|nr:hypothetical protein [Pseudomonas sp. S60]MBK5011946.1 hypothetical protein [Pseudomonas sp. S60]